MKVYAGIGSRKTPEAVQNKMFFIARILAKEGYILRSGGAEGADTAFEDGCDCEGGAKEIYLPWRAFNGNRSLLYTPSTDTYEISAKFHPTWQRLSQPVRKLMARNAHQVLGADCKSPVRGIICWTSDGEASGGTGQAIRIAAHYHIPVYNLYNGEDFVALKRKFGFEL